jgi:lipid II:glycine glycyltransferase (peptidoglycan interpeptide bridge formation enzyme)
LLSKAQPSASFYGHSLDLATGANRIFEGFHSSVRRAIRKAEKSGLQVEVMESEAGMREFYALQCKTRKRHCLPPQPLAFFLNLHRQVISKGKGFLITARHNHVPVASSLFLHWDRHGMYKFGASDGRLQEYRGSNLVMWSGIQKCVNLGLERLDFGRTSMENSGLRQFKLGWGTAEHQRYLERGCP